MIVTSALPNRIALSLGALLLAACVHYEAAVPPHELLARARPAESLDPALVAAELCHWLGPPCTPARPLDRITLVAIARVYSADIHAAAASIDAALARATSARQPPPGTLSLTAEYAIDAAESSPWLAGSSIDLPLDRGTRRETRIATADRGVLVARYRLGDALWTAHREVRRGLTDLLATEREIDLRQALAVVRETQLKTLGRRVALGEIARSEADRIRLDRAAEARALADAQARRAAALQRIAATLGVDPTALDDSRFEWPDFDLPSVDDSDLAGPSTDERSGALERRTEVLQALIDYEQADDDYRLEVGRQYPALSIAPGYTWERGLVKVPLGISLSLPPADLNRSAIDAAQRSRDAAAAALEAVCARITAEHSNARSALSTARAQLHELRSIEVPLALHLDAAAAAQFDSGSIDQAERAAARIGRIDTQLAELALLKAVRDAESDYEDAIRRPIEGPEQETLAR